MHRDLEIRLAVAVDVGLHDIVGRDTDYPVPLRLAVAAVIGGEMESLIAGLRTIGVDDAQVDVVAVSMAEIENRIPRHK
jgi:hypothetical protein